MRISENVHQIKIEFQVTEKIRRFVYVYLILGKDCYLVDSGVSGCQNPLFQKTIAALKAAAEGKR